MRLNGHGPLNLEDARTWIEETGLCLFLPKKQPSTFVAPSFVEAVAGHPTPTPDQKQIALSEQLLVHLENDGVAVRLNLLGLPGEQPDFVVAAWVLPYVYALRGDRDWRRSPQLTGSRQVSQLAIQAYKLLEGGEATISSLKHTLGREVSESAVLRAITELWQQLRIIPVIAVPGQPAKWQLLRVRFQKAIAEGASTSQVTAISVLASIYLQAVIAASMEDVELFLSPLTARSKVREVLRGLVATRQVHSLSLGHAPHFYVAGTLPEFAVAQTLYSSSSISASGYFLHAGDRDDDQHEIVSQKHVPAPPPQRKAPESHAPRVATSAARQHTPATASPASLP
jgi:23S rRNA pseudouridine2605 synthase